jgi:hypothetical protein
MPSAEGLVTCVPSQLVDVRAARPGVLVALQHERACALADHQAVALPVERARRELGPLILAGGGEHDVEDGRVAEVHLLGAAAQHHVLRAGADHLEGGADRLAAADAGRAGGDHTAGEPVVDGEVGRAGVAHELQVLGRLDAREPARDEHLAAPLLVRGGGAGGAAVRDAHQPAAQERLVEPGVAHRVFARVQAEQRHATHGAHLLARVAQRELAHGRAELRLHVGYLGEFRHPHDAVPVFAQGAGGGAEGVSDGTCDADAGDHDARTAHARPPLMPIT